MAFLTGKSPGKSTINWVALAVVGVMVLLSGWVLLQSAQQTRQVMPGHYGIPITEDLIARFGKDLLFRARGAAATDLEEAERLLADASAFLPADDAGVVAGLGVVGNRDAERHVDSGAGLDDVGHGLAEELDLPSRVRFVAHGSNWDIAIHVARAVDRRTT